MATANQLAEEHALVRDLAAGQAYTLTTGVWHTYDFEKTGASVMFDLTKPVAFEADWPYVEIDGAGSPMYPGSTFHEAYRNITQVYVLVDLGRSEVVEVMPDPLAELAR